ncbi:sensor histidine kinase, partial [Alistipes putredinis]
IAIWANMKFSSKQMIGENLLYLMVWMVIILVPVLNSKMLEEVHVSLENILIAWLKIAPYLLIFIIHNSLIAPRLLLRKHRYVWYLVVNLLTITAVFSLVAIYEKYAPYDTEPYILNGKASFTDLAIYWNILLGFFMTGLNMGIKLLYRSLRDEQQMEELKRQNLQAEMDYLRYQINPHFFMNTLNNIHALIDIDTEYAKSAVIELSKMMRYVLYESGSETISLKKDIQFIENYIELMRIRYDSSIDICLDYPATIPNKVAIPPLLLIVFVENAFKHGVSYNHASFIHIRIGYRDDAVTAVISNSRHEKSRPGTTGIGLENVKKRLALIYQDNYTLSIDDSDPAVYTVKLIIPIMPC